jgi:hypothetical protein
MTYNPPITNANQLNTHVVPSPDPTFLDSCRQQVPPARKLVNLLKVKVLVFQSEASYHAGYDYCTAQYLKDAGVPVDFVKLADVGLKGGAHMIMLEKYNLKVAAFMLAWLKDHIH